MLHTYLNHFGNGYLVNSTLTCFLDGFNYKINNTSYYNTFKMKKKLFLFFNDLFYIIVINLDAKIRGA